MSRQRGRRDRPAPEREEYRRRYSRRERRREQTPVTERPQWVAAISRGRRWAAVLAGTLVAVTSFGLVAAAVVAAGDGDDSTAVALSVAAALAVPVLLLVVGLVSRAATPWRTTLLASPLVLVTFLAGSFAAQDPATGFVVAIGVGGSLAMRADEGVHRRSWRLWLSVGLAVYTKIVYLTSPVLAIVAAPLLPLAGVGVVDRVVERRAEGR